jgi:hypothetical protein
MQKPTFMILFPLGVSAPDIPADKLIARENRYALAEAIRAELENPKAEPIALDVDGTGSTMIGVQQLAPGAWSVDLMTPPDDRTEPLVPLLRGISLLVRDAESRPAVWQHLRTYRVAFGGVPAILKSGELAEMLLNRPAPYGANVFLTPHECEHWSVRNLGNAVLHAFSMLLGIDD